MKIKKTAALLLALALAFSVPVQAEPEAQKIDAIDTAFYTPPGSNQPYPNPNAAQPTKNVILLIGDGMGLSETTLARLAACGAEGRLHMERLPVTGIVWTYSANDLVTDSAAAATALAGGVRTRNGKVGLSSDGGRVLTLAEAAKQQGRAAGLVVISTITHATPAGFGAHVPDRGDEFDSALDLRQSGIDVLLGGGMEYWTGPDFGGKRQDGRDLIAELRAAGYGIARNAAELKAASGPKLLGLFNETVFTDPRPEPSLEAMTAKAIETLSKNPKGFFLMVEGSRIDWAGHENDAEKLAGQVLLFDMAVKEAAEFAVKDGSTLVIVAADHETGGLVLRNGKLSGRGLEAVWATHHHTPTPVMLYAFGPGSPAFTGVQHHADVSRKIARALGVADFPKVAPAAKPAET